MTFPQQAKGPFAAVSSGVIAGILAVTVAAAYASLLYRGVAAVHVGFGFKLILCASALSAIWVTCYSRLPGLIAGPDDSAAVVLAGLAVIVAGQVAAAQGSPERAALTIAVLLALSSAATACVFYAVGHFRLGNIIRYLPSPVISGFLAGAGVLLFMSGLGLAAVVPELSLTHLNAWPLLFQQGGMIWPALAVALALWYGFRHIEHPLFMPCLLAVAGGVFFLLLAVCEVSTATARQWGWLFDLPAAGEGLPLSAWLTGWQQVDVAALLSVLPELLSVLLVVLIAMLLQTGSLENLLQQDIDVNQELKQTSGANFVAALSAGLPVVPFIGDTSLNLQLAGPNRIAGWVLAAVCVLAAIVGLELIQWLPTFVLAGILLFFGLSLLENSVWKGWHTLRRSDFLLVLLVALTINIAGFSVGTLLGVVLAAVIFLRDYSLLPVVRIQFNAANAPSRIDRAAVERERLTQQPQWLLGLELEGFIFFGSAHRVDKQVITALQSEANISYLILDFRRVQGIDASAAAVFRKIIRRVQQQQGTVFFAGLSPEVQHTLASALPDFEHIYLDLDHALEAAEDGYLQQHTPFMSITTSQPVVGLSAALLPYGELREVAAESVLIAEGQAASGLYFIVRGSVSVRSHDRMGKPIRLRRFTEGTVIGEMSHYLQRPTSAAVVADSALTVLCLSPQAIATLEQNQPQLAIRLHQAVATVLAQRLLATNQSLQAAIA